MQQPIMKCAYSHEQLKEQMDLMDYVLYLNNKLALSDAKLVKALEIIAWSKKWLQPVTLEKNMKTYTPIQQVTYLMDELNSLTLDSLEKEKK